MSEDVALAATGGPDVSPAAEKLVPALPASRAPEGGQSDIEPKPGEESSSDENVRRARRRQDVVPAEAKQAALAETMRHLGSMSRVPFRKVLAELVGAKPTPEAVRRFADKYPDRWAQAVSMMAGLAGFDRGVIELNLFNVKGLADSDLIAELRATRLALAKVAPKVSEVVDAEVIEEKLNPSEQMPEEGKP